MTLRPPSANSGDSSDDSSRDPRLPRRRRLSSSRQRRRRRPLSLEGLEVRALMNSDPALVDSWGPLNPLAPQATTTAALQAQELLRAFERMQTQQYTAAEIEAASHWVVLSFEPRDVAQLKEATGAAHVVASDLIANTYIFARTPETGGFDFARQLRGLTGKAHYYPIVARPVESRWIPNDPLFAQQWHLQNTGQLGGTPGIDANVVNVWDNYRGNGIVIGIVDDGLEHAHVDLVSKYRADLSWDYIGNDADPTPAAGRYHGTAVAGVAAASTDNNLGVAGVAPNAQIAGLRMLTLDDTDVSGSQSIHSQQIHIYNNSWGPYDASAWLEAPGPLSIAAWQNGSAAGRGGLGSIYVWAGGNGGHLGDNVNYDGYANSRYVFAIGAVGDNGVQSWYSEPGAPLLVVAPSNSLGGAGIITTDLMGDVGANQGPTEPDYNFSFGGTSSATPLVSGVIALMLEARPTLTQRDVMHILARTAVQVDASDASWTANGATLNVSHKYGFGMVDAQAAVQMALTWTHVQPEVSHSTGVLLATAPIPDNDPTGLTRTVTVNQDMRIERVEVIVSATHSYTGDLQFVLRSPSGTESILSEQHYNNGAPYSSWSFTTLRHLGEMVQGQWELTVRDLASGEVGTLDNWQLNFYGTAGSGFIPGGSISGFVYFDANQDGVKQGSESGVSNWVVFADINGNGVYDPGVDRAALTNAAGVYQITDLPAGTYNVYQVLQTGYTLTSSEPLTALVFAGQDTSPRNFGVYADRVTVTSTTTNANALRNALLGSGVVPVGNATFVGSSTSAGFFTNGGDVIGIESGILLTTGDARFAQGPNISGGSSGTASGAGDADLNAEYGFITEDTTYLQFQFQIEAGDLEFRYVFASEEYNEFANTLFNDVFAFFLNGQNIALIPGTTQRISVNTINGGNPLGVDAQNSQYYINNDPFDGGLHTSAFGYDGFTTVFTARAENLPGGIYTIKLAISDVGDTSWDSGVFLEGGSFTAIPRKPVIGGTAYVDSNGDGVQDPEERPLGGVLVFVDLDGNGLLGLGEPQAYTNANGAFTLELNQAGTFNLIAMPVSGYEVVTPAQGFHVIDAQFDAQISAQFGFRPRFDWGDLPAPYRTLAAHNGPSHGILPGYHLGTNVDSEANGQPSAGALGDDLTGGADDGVRFLTALIPGTQATIEIIAHQNGVAIGQPIMGGVQAWIDFNGDGDFDDAGEQILLNKQLKAGSNLVTFFVPRSAKIGPTGARFRLGLEANLPSTGRSQIGEVEDYIVGIGMAARADLATVAANSSGNVIPVLANDEGPAGAVLSVVAVTQPPSTVGTVAIGPGGAHVLFTPAADYSGPAVFTYTVQMGAAQMTQMVTVTVSPPPLGNSIASGPSSGAGSTTSGGTTSGGTTGGGSVSPPIDRRWHNATLPYDVNRDGVVNLADVVLVRNALRDTMLGRVPSGQLSRDNALVDVDGDGMLSMSDLLRMRFVMQAFFLASQASTSSEPLDPLPNDSSSLSRSALPTAAPQPTPTASSATGTSTASSTMSTGSGATSATASIPYLFPGLFASAARESDLLFAENNNWWWLAE